MRLPCIATCRREEGGIAAQTMHAFGAAAQGDSGEEPAPSLVALFTFVARDPVTGRAMRVNQLSPGTQQERERFAQRQCIAEQRKAARAAAAAAPAQGVCLVRPFRVVACTEASLLDQCAQVLWSACECMNTSLRGSCVC